MRIVGGKFKGRRIATPTGRNTRPTSDRAREAIFNILSHADWAPDLAGARVIDAFAGSGALGLEALSRGASFCLFIEMANSARRVIRSNATDMGLEEPVLVQKRMADALGDRPDDRDPFDIIFIDPPYEKGLVGPTLEGLRSGGWLTLEAALIIETAQGEDIDLDGWVLLDERNYGAACVRFIRQSVDA
ncbi:MAG: 16S rRNA (guanine(966)-N(2))-methyltransferase RsmD [Pseudomonadota bacterium]